MIQIPNEVGMIAMSTLKSKSLDLNMVVMKNTKLIEQATVKNLKTTWMNFGARNFSFLMVSPRCYFESNVALKGCKKSAAFLQSE